MNIFASPKIGGTFDAAAGLASQVMDIEDKHNREVADAALTKMNLDLDAWYKVKINDFRNRNDYENFQNEFQNGLKELEDKYQKGSSRYANGYMQKHGDELFDSLKANASVAVPALVENGKRNRALTDYDSSMEEIAAGGDDGDTKFTAIDSIITKEYQQGLIDPQEAEKKRSQYAVSCAYDKQVAAAVKLLDDTKGITEEQLFRAIDDDQTSFTGTIVDGSGAVTTGTRTVDNDAVHQAVKKYMASKIQELQDKNNQQLEQENTRILNSIYAGRSTLTEADIQKRIDGIEYGYSGIQMDVGDKRQREWELRQAKEALKGGGSGGGISSFESEWKKYVDGLDQSSRLGTNSGSLGIKSLYGGRDVFMNDYFYPLAQEFGLSESQVALEKNMVYNYFVDKGKQIYKGDSRMASSLSKLEAYAKSVSKDKGKNEIWNSALSYAMDYLYDHDPSTIDYTAFEKDVMNHIQTWTAQELDLLAEDKKGNSKYASKKASGGLFNQTPDELVASGAWEMQNNKLVYTNELEQTVTAKGLDKSIKRYDTEASSILSRVAGVKTSDLTADWKASPDGHDVTGTRIYTDTATGNKYEIVATDKKHYDVLKNGRKITDDRTVKSNADAAEKKAREERKAEIKAQGTKADAENQKIIDAEGRMADSSKKSPIPGLSDADWNGMARDQKILEIQRRRNSDKKFIDTILKY